MGAVDYHAFSMSASGSELAESIPIRSIFFTAERPRDDRPLCTGPTFEVEESANALLQRCVRVHYAGCSASFLSGRNFDVYSGKSKRVGEAELTYRTPKI